MSTEQPSHALPLVGADTHMADPASTAGQETIANTKGSQPTDDNKTSKNKQIESTTEPSNAGPSNNEDIVMTGAGPTTVQEAAANAGESQPANGSGDSEDENIPSYTPDDKKSEVLRILKWPDWAFYEILEVPETATEREIVKAFRKKSLLTHTDQNSDNGAKEVFRRVTDAKDTLLDSTKRQEHDKERAVRKSRGELVQNDLGENFAQNAYSEHGSDTEDDNEDDDEPEPMSQAKKTLLDDMEPLVKKVLDSCDEPAYKELENLNKKMRNLNKQENKDRTKRQVPRILITDHTPPLLPIKSKSESRRRQLEILHKPNQNAEAKKAAEIELEYLKDELRALLGTLDLPLSWADGVSNTTAPSAASQRSGNRRNAPSGASRQSRAENRQTSHPPTAPDNSTGQSLFDPMDTTPAWTPGQTTRGEKILAFRPVAVTGAIASTGENGQIYTSIRFVIDTGETNPIKIVDEARVGSPAVQAYLNLPKEKKCDLRHVDRHYERMDGFNFGEIKGVARDSNATTVSRLPWTVVLIEYHGERRLVNRTALRNAKKQPIADGLINEFLISVGEEPDAPKDERRLLLEQYDSGGRLSNFRGRSPRMLGNREEIYHDLDGSSIFRAGRATMSADSVHSRSRDSRQNRFGDHKTDAALNTPRKSYQPTSTRPQGPTPVRTAPTVHFGSRTSTIDTPPDMIRNDQHRTGAAAGEQVNRQEFNQLVSMLTQLVVRVEAMQET